MPRAADFESARAVFRIVILVEVESHVRGALLPMAAADLSTVYRVEVEPAGLHTRSLRARVPDLAAFSATLQRRDLISHRESQADA